MTDETYATESRFKLYYIWILAIYVVRHVRYCTAIRTTSYVWPYFHVRRRLQHLTYDIVPTIFVWYRTFSNIVAGLEAAKKGENKSLVKQLGQISESRFDVSGPEHTPVSCLDRVWRGQARQTLAHADMPDLVWTVRIGVAQYQLSINEPTKKNYHGK